VKRKGFSLVLWTLSILLMLFVSIYQRRTGPSYPIKKIEKFGETSVQYEFNRSSLADKSLQVKVIFNGTSENAFIMFRVYKSGEKWSEVKMNRLGSEFSGWIQYLSTATYPVPLYRLGSEFSGWIQGLPPAGKVEYLVKIIVNGEEHFLNNGRAAVARFRGDVPAIYMIPHIVLMFLAILFGARTGMEALRKDGDYSWMVIATLIIVILGGLVFGPIIQNYAFGKFWTGVPFGFDLTDNKTLLSIIFWIAAFCLKKKSKYWVVAAAALMIIIYFIPHSVLGSELDPKTGLIKTGF
jgi:hypothetical protein